MFSSYNIYLQTHRHYSLFFPRIFIHFYAFMYKYIYIKYSICSLILQQTNKYSSASFNVLLAHMVVVVIIIFFSFLSSLFYYVYIRIFVYFIFIAHSSSIPLKCFCASTCKFDVLLHCRVEVIVYRMVSSICASSSTHNNYYKYTYSMYYYGFPDCGMYYKYGKYVNIIGF